MTKMRKMTIEIELGGAEMLTPHDASGVLNKIREALHEADTIEDIRTRYHDANGHGVCNVSFESKYDECKVVFICDAGTEPETAEQVFAKHVGADNFCDLDEDDLEREENGSKVHYFFTAQVDRDFLDSGTRRHFKSPGLEMHIIYPSE